MTTVQITEAGRIGDRLSRDLLVCGIISSIWYAAMNVLVPLQWAGYSSAAQTISELSAIDAPTRTLWMLLAIPYTLLIAAFGWGTWRFGGELRAMRATGAVIFAFGALGVFWPFAPMHLREALAHGAGSASDTLHIGLGVASVLLMIIAMSSASAALGRWFTVYSVGTIAIVLIFGAMTGAEAADIGANRPTPFVGVWERISVGAFLLWVAVLSMRLRRSALRLVTA